MCTIRYKLFFIINQTIKLLSKTKYNSTFSSSRAYKHTFMTLRPKPPFETFSFGTSPRLLAPRQVVVGGGGLVLVDELADDLVAGVHFVQVVLEHVLLAELVEEGLALVQLTKLLAGPLEQFGY